MLSSCIALLTMWPSSAPRLADRIGVYELVAQKDQINNGSVTTELNCMPKIEISEDGMSMSNGEIFQFKAGRRVPFGQSIGKTLWGLRGKYAYLEKQSYGFDIMSLRHPTSSYLRVESVDQHSVRVQRGYRPTSGLTTPALNIGFGPRRFDVRGGSYIDCLYQKVAAAD